MNGLTFWTSTQAPHWNRNESPRRSDIPETQVRGIAPEVGGGFGVKIGAYREDFIVCARSPSSTRAAGEMDRDALRELPRHQPRPRPMGRRRDRRRRKTARSRRCSCEVMRDPGAYPKGLDLAWCDRLHVDRLLRHPDARFRSRRLHQHDGASAPIAARAGRKRPTTSSG